MSAARTPRLLFDAHLDLAYLAVSGRDMLAPSRSSDGPHAPSCVTLPALESGNVRLALATIFTEPVAPGTSTAPEAYPAGDAERAFIVGRAQLEVYRTWADLGRASLAMRERLAGLALFNEVRAGMGSATLFREPATRRASRLLERDPVLLGVLMENADPIRTPAELPWWVERGLVAVGLAWAKSSRYAGGNTTNEGITPLGHELVEHMDRLGVVHDVSHLSDRAFDELMELTPRPVIASHSNCRAIVDHTGTNQRHLRDDQIARIASRGGVIGLNLYSKFLSPRCAAEGRCTIDEAVAHIERVCEIADKVTPERWPGDDDQTPSLWLSGRDCVALGSDADGGFPASRLPEGIDGPAQFHRLADALSARGWRDDEVDNFAFGNWVRVLEAGTRPARTPSAARASERPPDQR